MLRGPPVLGTAFSRDLGAITHHCAPEENSTRGSRVAKKWNMCIRPDCPLMSKSQPESLKSWVEGRKAEGLLRKYSQQDGGNWGAYQELLLREKSWSQENSRNLTNVVEGGKNCSAKCWCIANQVLARLCIPYRSRWTLQMGEDVHHHFVWIDNRAEKIISIGKWKNTRIGRKLFRTYLALE